MTLSSQLMSIFEFDEADLEANRAGHQSPRQRRQFFRGALGLMIFVEFLILILSTIIFVQSDSSLSTLLTNFAIMSALFVVFTLVQWVMRWRVHTTEGIPELKLGKTEYTTFIIDIGGRKFYISRQIYHGLKESGAWAIPCVLSGKWVERADSIG
jgi:hypothetical protein